jgi:hypothetical protein
MLSYTCLAYDHSDLTWHPCRDVSDDDDDDDDTLSLPYEPNNTDLFINLFLHMVPDA